MGLPPDKPKETRKRLKKNNVRFESGKHTIYGLLIITFTDSNLKDMDGCFEQIKMILEERMTGENNIQAEENKLRTIIKKAR